MPSRVFEGSAVWAGAVKGKWVDVKESMSGTGRPVVSLIVDGFVANMTPEQADRLADMLRCAAARQREIDPANTK